MQRSFLMLLIGLCFTCGCASNHSIDSLQSQEQLQRLNMAVAGRKARLLLQDGTTLKVSQLNVGSEQTSFFTKDSSERRLIPTTDIVQITVKRVGRGALQGLGIGLGAGFLIGLAIAAPDTGDSVSNEVDEFFTGSITVPVLGIVAGTLAGAQVGSPQHFNFQLPPPSGEESVESSSSEPLP